MGVFIKGMEMPQGSCEWVDKDCHLHRCKLLNGDDDCKMQEGLCSTITWQEQFANCPLVEVQTPHGRLGDLDELWDKMSKYTDNEGAKMPFGYEDFMIHRDSACELVEDAPTIIEAEWSNI